MEGILRINRIRPKKYSLVSGNRPGKKFFDCHPAANLGQWKAISNKLHRATHIKSTNLKINSKKNKCLRFVYIHFTFRLNEATYVFKFQIKIYARCSLIINACGQCLHFAINCISLLYSLHWRFFWFLFVYTSSICLYFLQ